MIAALMIGRAGSTGFPGKNLYPILGRPLAEYPLLAARASRHVDRLYVSTDSPEIMEIGQRFGAESIERPPELATKAALGEDVFQHGYREIVKRLAAEGKEVELMVLLFANAATITGELIDTKVFYHGTPVAGSFGFQIANARQLIWSLSEPYGARSWWPCKDVPEDKADSVSIRYTVPTGMITASNGTRLQATDNGTQAVTRWSERHPIATYLVSIASYPYTQTLDWYRPSPTDSVMRSSSFWSEVWMMRRSVALSTPNVNARPFLRTCSAANRAMACSSALRVCLKPSASTMKRCSRSSSRPMAWKSITSKASSNSPFSVSA